MKKFIGKIALLFTMWYNFYMGTAQDIIKKNANRMWVKGVYCPHDLRHPELHKDPKYELVEYNKDSPKPQYKIRALKDIPEHHVSKGDFGGIVHDYCLDQEGSCWIGEGVEVIGRHVDVFGNALVHGRHLIIADDCSFGDNTRILAHGDGEHTVRGTRVFANASIDFKNDNLGFVEDCYLSGDAQLAVSSGYVKNCEITNGAVVYAHNRTWYDVSVRDGVLNSPDEMIVIRPIGTDYKVIYFNTVSGTIEHGNFIGSLDGFLLEVDKLHHGTELKEIYRLTAKYLSALHERQREFLQAIKQTERMQRGTFKCPLEMENRSPKR